MESQKSQDERQQILDEQNLLSYHELGEFVAEQQPDDRTRHMLALLSLPKDKIWTEGDLSDEFCMRLGLLLLLNKIHGQHELHFGRSIHIRYLAFPKEIVEKMNAQVQPSAKREAKAQDFGI